MEILDVCVDAVGGGIGQDSHITYKVDEI
jgi:hypothetical protein